MLSIYLDSSLSFLILLVLGIQALFSSDLNLLDLNYTIYVSISSWIHICALLDIGSMFLPPTPQPYAQHHPQTTPQLTISYIASSKTFM